MVRREETKMILHLVPRMVLHERDETKIVHRLVLTVDVLRMLHHGMRGRQVVRERHIEIVSGYSMSMSKVIITIP